MLAGFFAYLGLLSEKLELSFVLPFRYQNSWYAGIIVQLPAIHQHLVSLEIFDAMRKAAPDDFFWNIMPALNDTVCNSLDGDINIRQGQEYQLHRITG